MVYCINPQCQTLNNVKNDETCTSCGGSLKLGQFQQQILKPLNSERRRARQIKRLFLVRDRQARIGVMEVFDDGFESSSELFQCTANLLRQVQHPGIPQYFEQFIIVTPNGDRLSCLVREHIPGEDLEVHLKKAGVIPAHTAQKWLIQICHILGAIHQQGFLHLDVKPGNIILGPQDHITLIDFSQGAASISAGYSPNEQADGSPSPASDIHALGRTMVQLLTGKHPLDFKTEGPKGLNRADQKSTDPTDPKTGESNHYRWQDSCSDLPQGLGDVINAMIQTDVEQRLGSTDEVLQRLEAITKPIKLRQFQIPNTILLYTTGVSILFGFGLALIIPPQLNPIQNAIARWVNPQNYLACHPKQAPNLSCGERSLSPGSQGGVEANKKQGHLAFAAQDYQTAFTAFEQARQNNPLDPEVVIYQNNAQIKLKGLPTYTIVVAAPAKVRSLSDYILRGVAQLQSEVNQRPEQLNGRSLQIMIADDGNNPDQAKELAEKLVKKQDVVGIIGHYASELTIASLPVYQEAQIPVISYGSTSRELSCNNPITCPDNVFFRTVPTTIDEARNLATYAIQEQIHQNIGVVFNQASPFSRSLKSEFEGMIQSLNGKITEIIPACTQGKFNEAKLRERLAELNVSAVALFPDGQVCETSSINSIALANATEGKYPILNSWTFDAPEIYKQLNEAVFKRTITGAPWHHLSHQSELFRRDAQRLWQQESLSEVLTGLSATSYDAAKVLVEALGTDNLETTCPASKTPGIRADILNKLRCDSTFEVVGATGTIQFLGSDRRQNQLVLLRPKVSSCPQTKSSRTLTPLNFGQSQEPEYCNP